MTAEQLMDSIPVVEGEMLSSEQIRQNQDSIGGETMKDTREAFRQVREALEDAVMENDKYDAALATLTRLEAENARLRELCGQAKHKQ